MRNTRFWMVYGETQGPPTVMHASRHLAKTEAARLARQNPGIAFYVLEAVEGVEKQDLRRVVFDADPQPPRPF